LTQITFALSEEEEERHYFLAQPGSSLVGLSAQLHPFDFISTVFACNQALPML